MNTQITFSILADKTAGVYTHMEYVNCVEKIETVIKFSFYTAATFRSINFDNGTLKIIPLVGGMIGCTLKKVIPKNLFDDLKNSSPEIIRKNIPNVILGYIHKTLPIINDEILKRRYIEGHIMARMVSIFDIAHISVSSSIDPKNGAFINWPLGLAGFPQSSELAKNNDFLYIRDLIDAMACYFEYNFDECIRKIITSLENYFDEYGLNAPRGLMRKIFKVPGWKMFDLVHKYINKPFYLINEEYLKIIRENILYIYKLRVQIVHKKLRISPQNDILCKKALITLCIIYESAFCGEVSHYIFNLQEQFRAFSDDFIMDIETYQKVYSSNNPLILDAKLPKNQRYILRLINSFIETNCLTIKNGHISGSPVLTKTLYGDLKISRNEKKRIKLQ